MRSCVVLLIAAVSLCFAAEEGGVRRCRKPDGSADERCEKAARRMQQLRQSESQCRADNNVTPEDIRNSRCKIPSDPEVQERVGKYSLCSLLNLRQVLPNGSYAVPKACQEDAAAAAAAATTPATTETRARRPKLTRCALVQRTAACLRGKEAEAGSSAEQRAMALRVCTCDAKRYAVAVARCEAEEVQRDPYCAELRRRRQAEQQCRKDQGLVSRQIREWRCKLPDDPEVKEKMAKYALCSLQNSGLMLSNGTTQEVFPGVHCNDATVTTTEGPQRNKKRQDHIAFLCDMKKKMSTCLKEKEESLGTSDDQKAQGYQLCKCEMMAEMARRRRQQKQEASQ